MHELVHGSPSPKVDGRKTTMGRKANAGTETATATAKVKLSLEDKIEMLRQASKSDKVIASGLAMVETAFEEFEAAKTEAKRQARRLRNIIRGLMSGN